MQTKQADCALKEVDRREREREREREKERERELGGGEGMEEEGLPQWTVSE